MAPATLSRLGDALGDQSCLSIDYPPMYGMNAAQIDTDRFLITGNAGVAIVQPASKPSILTRDLSNPIGLAKISEGRFIVASDLALLSELDIATNAVYKIARYNARIQLAELALSSDGSGYVFVYYTAQHGVTKGMVAQFRFE